MYIQDKVQYMLGTIRNLDLAAAAAKSKPTLIE
jgi:hypothetical protein